jgi:ABC-type transport system involved in cytochrome bd biosynthesis fused ATPase/permease subunit
VLAAKPWRVRLETPSGTCEAEAGDRAVLCADDTDLDAAVEALLLETTSGRARATYEEVTAADLRHDGARKRIEYVNARDALSGTVLENVGATAEAAVDRARARKALEAVGYTGSLDARVGRGGAPLSAMEVSAIGLARAALSSPSVVVLDRVLDLFEPQEAARLLGTLSHTTCIVLTRRHEIAEAARIRPVQLAEAGGQP